MFRKFSMTLDSGSKQAKTVISLKREKNTFRDRYFQEINIFLNNYHVNYCFQINCKLLYHNDYNYIYLIHTNK